MGGVGGSASDAEIEAREIIKMRERLNQTFADQTGQPIERVRKDSDRNFWMSPSEAVEYGLVGKVIKSISDLA
jgi:ATP-dependent Clp protease protease subunit